MWSLKRPTISAQSTFTTCISRVRDRMLATRLANAEPAVTAASADFDKAARLHSLHQIVAQDKIAPDITKDEMEKVYAQRMAKIGSPGRNTYDKIIVSAPRGRCPLCMQRLVSTLDHHLPKAHYVALAVTPLNLIPACADCNRAKLDVLPRTAEEVPLHPYYDDLGDEVWLIAIVVESRPSALRFEIVRSRAWDDTLFARVKRHFHCLNLGVMFASEAAEELLNIRHQLEILRDADPENGVRGELERRAESCAAERTNSWRSAAFRAWSESDWFCRGGFLTDR